MWLVEVNSDHFLLKGIFECVVFMAKDNNRFYNNNNNNNFFLIIQNFIHRFKKIDYLQIQEYEILKYIPYVHSSCIRKRIVLKWLSKDY